MMRAITIAFLTMGLFSGLFGGEKPKEEKKDFPPVPAWEPEIELPMDKIIDRFRYFTDGAGRRLSMTDPLGNLTRYDYDPLNRLIKNTDALGGMTTFAFDANSNLLSHTDAKGGVTSYTYDTLNRLATRKDPLL